MTITLSEFEESLGDVTFPLAVAISGGSDSLALLLLAYELAQRKGSHVVALTVDHGLRSESKEEATRVGKWAKTKGIDHVTLEWEGDKPSSRLQESARKARYALLTEWCQQNHISTLLLGHHQQDQEETFWLRLSSGSGLDGLSGMKKRTLRDGILFLRPLLDFPKERLKETLQEKNQEWIEDPTNQNSRFFRGRLRQFLSEEGLSSFRLSQVIKKFQVDADFIQHSVNNAIENNVQAHDGGYLTVKKDSFNELHPAIAKRLLSFLLQWFSNPDYPPRESKVIGILEKIKKGSPFTVGGIYWTFSRDEIFLLREKRAINEKAFITIFQEVSTVRHCEAPKESKQSRVNDNNGALDCFPPFSRGSRLPPRRRGTSLGRQGLVHNGMYPIASLPFQEKILWDQRFLIDMRIRDFIPEEVVIGPLGCVPELMKEINSLIPAQVWPTLPALWVKGKVVAVPHLCYNVLECEKDLRKFIYLKPLFHDSLRPTI